MRPETEAPRGRPRSGATPPSLKRDERPPLGKVLARLSAQLDPARTGAGPLAEVRRMSAPPWPPSFWRLYLSTVPREWREPGNQPDQRVDHAWAALIRAMAQMAPRPSVFGASFGAALARSGYSEHRFVRLLRSRGEDLGREIRTAGHWLGLHGQPVDWLPAARLVLGRTAPPLRLAPDRAGHWLAADYFREQARV